MAKNDMNYFEAFVDLVGFSCQAADLLNDIMHNFNAEDLGARMKQMHVIEHSGDEARHEMMKKLAKEL